MKTHHVILTAVGALALGAGVALLLAPRKGKETRGMILKSLKKYCPCEKKSTLDELADKIEDEIAEARGK